jgi:eukaryotic-like serine/threonine-protein kinase
MSEETSIVRKIGRYHAVDELGRGGMGIVYKGFDPVIGRTVALKTIGISGQGAEAKQLRERLYREASAAGTLTHPNIVTIYDVIEDGDTTAVAMEFVEGRTLADLLAEKGPLPLDRAVELFEEICSALDYAGAKGIVHRDIKPANVLLTPDGRAKITDFGIARMAISGLTQTGTIMGSPSYMSPEQVRGVPLDPRSDLFSAAVVLFEMLTGERPFGGDDVATTMYRIVNEPPKALDVLNVSIHPAVSGVLQRALAKNPAERFQTGAEAVAELKRSLGIGTGQTPGMTVMAGLQPMPSMPPLPPPAPIPAKSRMPVILAGAGAIVIILLITLVLIGKSRQSGGQGGSPDGAQTVQVPAGQDLSSAPPVSVQAPEPAPAASASNLSGPVSTVPPPPKDLGFMGEPLPSPRTPAATAKPATASSTLPPPTRGAEQPVEPPPAPKPPRDAPAATRPAADAEPPVVKTAEAPPQPAAPAGDATLRVEFDGEPYPVTLFADDERIGTISQPGTVTLGPGSVKLRAVAESVFLSADVASLSLRPGDRKSITLPGLASAVFNVKGEDYTGVRIVVDGRQVPGPYPAQIGRIAAGAHNVVYRWVSGPSAGRELTKAVTFSARGHFLVRAVVDNADIVVQQLR